MKGNYQKPLKKLTLFFLSNAALFTGQSYQKQKGPGTSDFLQKFHKKQVHKNFFNKLCIIWPSLILNYSTYICPLESGKRGKEGGKLQIRISWERKEPFKWNKKHVS